MSAGQEDFSRITRMALESLENNLLFAEFVNREYEDRLGQHTSSKPISKFKMWKNEVRWYLWNLKLAWLDAIKALAGIDPHERCDEDY